jgi:hypothetical protein
MDNSVKFAEVVDLARYRAHFLNRGKIAYDARFGFRHDFSQFLRAAFISRMEDDRVVFCQQKLRSHATKPIGRSSDKDATTRHALN